MPFYRIDQFHGVVAHGVRQFRDDETGALTGGGIVQFNSIQLNSTQFK